MTGEASAILAGLRRQGVVVDLDHDRLTVDAPVGVVNDEIRGNLHLMKPALLEALRDEQQVLDLSVREFEVSDWAIEARVPWFEDTVWFVPRTEQASTLISRGISRGRIWTAAQLIDFATVLTRPPNEIRRIARLKAAFGAEIIRVSREDGPSEEGRA